MNSISMKTIKALISLLFCFTIVSCANQQEIAPTMTANPTLHPTVFPTQPQATETPYPIEVETLVAISTYFPERIEVLQGVWTYNDGRLQFIRSRVSFVLPENWDVVNMTSEFDHANKFETQIISRNSIVNNNGEKSTPTIIFIFESVPVGMDSLEYFTNKIANNNLCKIDEVFQKGNGILNLDAAIGYECSYISEGVQHTMYTIYFTSNFYYETTGVQITMDSSSDVFSQVDPEFVKFMQSLSITY